MDRYAAAPVPTEIKRADNTKLRVRWNDGHESVYGGAALRRACRCAGCVDEWSGAALLDPATVPEDISATNVKLVGRYAINIEWSDGHASGIYDFRRLRSLCPCEACRQDNNPPGASGT